MTDRAGDASETRHGEAQDAENSLPEASTTDIHRAPGRDLGEISAQTVLLERSGAESITADTLRMERSGARSIEAGSIEMVRSGTVALGSDHAVLHHSSAVQVVGEHVELFDSQAVFVAAERATIDRSRIVVFAGNADGDVQTVITTKAAAIAGGAFALVLVLGSTLLRSKHR